MVENRSNFDRFFRQKSVDFCENRTDFQANSVDFWLAANRAGQARSDWSQIGPPGIEMGSLRTWSETQGLTWGLTWGLERASSREES